MKHRFLLNFQHLFLVVKMENDKDTSEMIKKGSKAAEQTAETIGDTIIQVIDRLAGKKSDLRLTFDNLELGAQGINARINGAIVLDVIMAQDAQTTSSSTMR
jgi:hypothetical protein